MYDWVLNTPLKGFTQDAPREELAIALIGECLTTIAWQNITNKLAISSTTDTLLKTQSVVDVLVSCSTKRAVHCIFHGAL